MREIEKEDDRRIKTFKDKLNVIPEELARELDKFEERYGYPPTQFRVALDALAIFVNKDNPIVGLTLQEIDAAFSINRKRWYVEDVDDWYKLGIPLEEQKVLAGVAVDVVFDSVSVATTYKGELEKLGIWSTRETEFDWDPEEESDEVEVESMDEEEEYYEEDEYYEEGDEYYDEDEYYEEEGEGVGIPGGDIERYMELLEEGYSNEDAIKIMEDEY